MNDYEKIPRNFSIPKNQRFFIMTHRINIPNKKFRGFDFLGYGVYVDPQTGKRYNDVKPLKRDRWSMKEFVVTKGDVVWSAKKGWNKKYVAKVE